MPIREGKLKRGKHPDLLCDQPGTSEKGQESSDDPAKIGDTRPNSAESQRLQVQDPHPPPPEADGQVLLIGPMRVVPIRGRNEDYIATNHARSV